ncbi:hypothetical protein FLAVO9AF_60017 [Flavobacterium sp. 9AF]|nr:hypothetical protein FLAVO9AF_60017 [Flavobacterium sp. 9AF]
MGAKLDKHCLLKTDKNQLAIHILIYVRIAFNFLKLTYRYIKDEYVTKTIYDLKKNKLSLPKIESYHDTITNHNRTSLGK